MLPQRRYELATIKPDAINAISIDLRGENDPRSQLRQQILRNYPNRHGEELLELINSYVNPTKMMSHNGFPTADIAFVIYEYKKDVSPKYVRQLAMAMTTALHHQQALGLTNPIAFGFLIERSVATLYAGWMPVSASLQVRRVRCFYAIY